MTGPGSWERLQTNYQVKVLEQNDQGWTQVTVGPYRECRVGSNLPHLSPDPGGGAPSGEKTHSSRPRRPRASRC